MWRSRSSMIGIAARVIVLALMLCTASPALSDQADLNPVPGPDRTTGELHAYSENIDDANTLFRQALWHVIAHPRSRKTIDGKDVTERYDLTRDGRANLVVRYRVLDSAEMIRMRLAGYSPEFEFGCPCRLNTIDFYPLNPDHHRFIKRNDNGVWSFVPRSTMD